MKNELQLIAYKNNKIIFQYNFNGNAFYESIFVHIGSKYNLISLPLGYHENSLTGLRLRRSYCLTSDEKRLVYEHPRLTVNERYILDLTRQSYVEIKGQKSIDDFVSRLSGQTMGNLEDINYVLDEHEKDIKILKLDKIELKKICLD